MKKTISLLLTLCCMMFSANIAIAEDTYTQGDWVYDTQTNEIVDYNGKGGTVIIPEGSVVSQKLKFRTRGLQTVTGENVSVSEFVCSENVTVKGDLGLAAYDGFKEVEFKNTADLMPNVDFYFANCENLKKLILPEGLTQIPDSMCFNCVSLKELYIPDTVKEIGSKAFYSCKSLTEMILPKELVKFGDEALKDCSNIKKLYVPKSIDALSVDVPYNLETIEFEIQPKYTADFYRYFIRTKWFENELIPSLKTEFLTADGYLFKYLGNAKNVAVPNDIKVIESAAFAKSNIEKITLPESVKKIESSAFKECVKLKEIVIPKSVEFLGFGAFSECDSLAKVIIEGSPVMDANVFEYCPLLNDDTLEIKGKIKPIDNTTNPFEFMGIEFPTPIPNDAVIIPNQIATPKPTETAEPTAKPTAEPTATLAPEVLTVEGGEEIKISVNGKSVEFDTNPFVDDNGRTQVPVRAVSEMLNAKVDWQQDIKTAVITKNNGDTVKITLDSDVMTVNNKQVKMDTAAMLKDERTFIPVRFVAEALGLTVNWVE